MKLGYFSSKLTIVSLKLISIIHRSFKFNSLLLVLLYSFLKPVSIQIGLRSLPQEGFRVQPFQDTSLSFTFHLASH